MATTDDHRALLAASRLCVLATIKRDGLPQLSPVQPFYDDEAGTLQVSMTEDRAKAKNLRSDPRAAVESLLEWTAPVRREHGVGDPAFPDRNAAQRQRALIAEGLSPREVYAATVRETLATYAQEVPTA